MKNENNKKYPVTENKPYNKKIDGITTPPAYTFLSGAEHYRLNRKNGVWHPSDEAVEEMRNFSQEHRV